MMRPASSLPAVYVCVEAVDFRLQPPRAAVTTTSAHTFLCLGKITPLFAEIERRMR